MKQIYRVKVVILLFTLLLASCASMESGQDMASAETVWIDVRTVEEYANDHIEGDRNIPIQSIDAATIADQLGLDRDASIGLYCASGGRAGRALSILEEAGFTNAFNAGGISDARDQRQLR